ncbi:DUF3710 domain-containing protein [Rarobacter faecitabidus]|uniref:Uncharacterized protein DUF3710 n=1 Tax=Rarobacter faecitabidus TaxID=13243 RepID=A0A542ZW12_RARFA|nr:DUF3710 domain-containing protein [Rarobacter faecitabidus]TQL64547.1 uncharacterized protein DUF3710 [Rarobacter faecitabidus]
MGIFSRKSKGESSTPEAEHESAESTLSGAADEESRGTERAATGPWDVTERPEPGELIDFGALRVPGVDGMSVRLQADSQDVIGGITIQIDQSSLQLNVFAAPRNSGVWDDVRSEVAASITRDGGVADEAQGPFGTELHARVPVNTPRGGSHGLAPARFIGVDGPRWFVRAVITGKAAVDEAAAKDLEGIIGGIVVVRGTEARPPREVLALTAPNVVAPAPATPEAKPDDFNPLERGPEITEIR